MSPLFAQLIKQEDWKDFVPTNAVKLDFGVTSNQQPFSF